MRNRLRWQIFMRCALLLIFASLLIGIVLGGQNIRNLSDESDRLVESSLRASAAWLDARLSEMNAIGYHIMDASLLYPYEVFRNGYASSRATNILNSYKNANIYLSDIVLYYAPEVVAIYDAQPRYFTTAGSFDPAVFWKSIHPVTDGRLSPEVLVKLPHRPQILYPVVESSKANKERYLLYLCPASRESAGVNKRGLIMFFIKDEVLRKGMTQTAQLYGGSFSVYDSEGMLLYAYAEPAAPVREIPQHYQTPLMQKKDTGVEMTLRTSAHGLTYVLHIPAGVTELAVNGALSFLLPFLLALICLTLAGAWLWLSPLLKPMNQLRDMLSPYAMHSDESLNGVVYSIRELEAHKNRLEALGNQRAILARIQLLHNLLHGNYASMEELEEQMQLCECDLHAPRYMVFSCMLLSEGEATGRILDLRAAAMHVLTETERLEDEFRYAVPRNRENELVLLCGLPDDADASLHARRLFEGARGILQKKTGVALVMGYGGCSDTLLGVERIYASAKKALSRYYLHGGEALLCDAQTRADLSDGWYPAREELELHALLVSGDAARARATVCDMMQSMRMNDLPEHIVKSVCFSLVRGLMKLAENLRFNVEDDSAYRDLIRSIEAPKATLQQFCDSLCAYCGVFCERRIRSVAEGGDKKECAAHCRQIESYLQTHFDDQMLTLTKVAAQFQLSEGHVSRIFKAGTGATMMQYLDTLRMENAKKLLRETELPINDIILQSGYVDKSNFFRKFKKLNNLTPVQYREMFPADRPSKKLA